MQGVTAVSSLESSDLLKTDSGTLVEERGFIGCGVPRQGVGRRAHAFKLEAWTAMDTKDAKRVWGNRNKRTAQR